MGQREWEQHKDIYQFKHNRRRDADKGMCRSREGGKERERERDRSSPCTIALAKKEREREGDGEINENVERGDDDKECSFPELPVPVTSPSNYEEEREKRRQGKRN